MKCLNDKKMIKYMEDELNGLEYSLARDHILSCGKCKQSLKSYESLEIELNKPDIKEPPAVIEKYVIDKLFPHLSHVASLVTFIAASFLLLITGIYIYFDFANDSMIKAFQLTKNQATSVISGTVKFISSVFSGLITVFKAINSLIEVLLNVRIGVEITGILFVLVLATLFYLIYNKLFLRIKDSKTRR